MEIRLLLLCTILEPTVVEFSSQRMWAREERLRRRRERDNDALWSSVCNPMRWVHSCSLHNYEHSVVISFLCSVYVSVVAHVRCMYTLNAQHGVRMCTLRCRRVVDIVELECTINFVHEYTYCSGSCSVELNYAMEVQRKWQKW